VKSDKMLIRDQFGYVHQVPDRRLISGLSSHLGEARVVYDRLGNPLGMLPFIAALAPLAAKLLPMAASVLPMLARRGRAAPARPQARAAAPPVPVAQPPPVAPSVAAPAPQIIIIREPAPAPPRFFPLPAPEPIVFRRRYLRRRAPVPVATESGGGLSGY
jgi:hypothetical protein